MFLKPILPYAVILAGAPVWAQLTMNSLPSREFGQHALVTPIVSVAPNMIEGRELSSPSAVAFDTSVSPPIMYVADTGNNRVLAWRNPDGLSSCGTAAAITCGVADLAIGQQDKFSNLAQGPGDQGSTQGSALSGGLSAPVAVAVDAVGNLYVADAGNNRILRFPAPFNQTGALKVDLVIGQASVSAGAAANQGSNVPTAQTLSFCCGPRGALLHSGLAFDSAGNLWVTDPGNNRVLRFPGANAASNQLAPNTLLPAADIVLGQKNFIFNTLGPSPSVTSGNILVNPSSLAFDMTGGLYVLDGYSRVLYFSAPPYQKGQAASRILGIVPAPSAGQPPTTYPNRYSLGIPNQTPPQGVFTLGNVLYVCDTSANRIVRYDVPANWPAATNTAPSPPIVGVVGQPDMASGKANRGQAEPDATTLNGPLGGAILNGEMWVADASNNRVLAYAPGNGFTTAARVVGQLDFKYDSVNLIEGREVFFNDGGSASAGLVVDAASTPPHLYIADSLNNRILGFKDARTVNAGDTADLVIGQPDVYRSVVNYPSGNAATPNNAGLQNPIGLVVDADGNLLVADSGNGRVLRFPSPFTQPPGAPQTANLVLGQADFASQIPDASQQTMKAPFGLALFSDGSLAVSDYLHNRVLIFERPPHGDFTNGQAAFSVLGQPDFASTSPGSAESSTAMFSPRHIAADASDRLYVCDSGNNRVMIFANARVASNGLAAANVLTGLNLPQGVAVNALTGEFWVANTNSQQLLRFPPYETWVLNNAPLQTIPSAGPIAVALDSFENVVAAELVNRVALYFPQLAYRNSANQNTQPVPPGSLLYSGRPGVDFSFTPASAPSATWPTTLGGIQVLMNGTTPCPISSVTGALVFFQVPSSVPTSGFADFQVVDFTTGQIYADSEVPMGVANPGFYTSNSQGFGQAAAINLADGTVNGPSHPARSDGAHYIQFYLTGLGSVPGAPPDGEPPPSPVPAPSPPVVLSTGCLDGLCPNSSVEFSGLAAYPGVWVINFLVPNTFPAGCGNVIALAYNNVLSNVGPNGKIQVTFCTK